MSAEKTVDRWQSVDVPHLEPLHTRRHIPLTHLASDTGQTYPGIRVMQSPRHTRKETIPKWLHPALDIFRQLHLRETQGANAVRRFRQLVARHETLSRACPAILNLPMPDDHAKPAPDLATRRHKPTGKSPVETFCDCGRSLTRSLSEIADVRTAYRCTTLDCNANHAVNNGQRQGQILKYPIASWILCAGQRVAPKYSNVVLAGLNRKFVNPFEQMSYDETMDRHLCSNGVHLLAMTSRCHHEKSLFENC